MFMSLPRGAALLVCFALTPTLFGQDPPLELDFGEEIDFDMEQFEDFTSGDFGAPEPTAEEIAARGTLMAGVFLIIGLLSVVFLLLTAFVAYLLMDALNAVPESHRQLSPAIPWLLFVPLVNLVILFLVFIKVPESLSNYLASTDTAAPGDCGKSMGLWGAILWVVPCATPIGMVLLILSLLNISQAKKLARSIGVS